MGERQWGSYTQTHMRQPKWWRAEEHVGVSTTKSINRMIATSELMEAFRLILKSIKNWKGVLKSRMVMPKVLQRVARISWSPPTTAAHILMNEEYVAALYNISPVVIKFRQWRLV